jgi:transposase
MGKSRKEIHQRYTLAFKLHIVRLTEHPNVVSKDIAEALGIHPVMLYRWRMEVRNGVLAEAPAMKKKPTDKPLSPDVAATAQAELTAAQKRIKQLEKALALREEELDILKKAEQFFAKNRR